MNQNLQNAINYFSFSSSALENIAETDADALGDLAKIRSGVLSREMLLIACLDGADDDRACGWRDYVDEIVRVAQSPSTIDGDESAGRNKMTNVAQIQSQSNAAWEMAVDTAGPDYQGGSVEKREVMQSLADECDACYDAAIAALEAEEYGEALDSLRQARSLESEGGDCSHADRAIAAVESLRQARSLARTHVTVGRACGRGGSRLCYERSARTLNAK